VAPAAEAAPAAAAPAPEAPDEIALGLKKAADAQREAEDMIRRLRGPAPAAEGSGRAL
jgi:hypothetical protein